MYRSPVTHKMRPWVQRVFIEVLPRFLLIERPKKDDDDEEGDDKAPHSVIAFEPPPSIDKYIG